MCADSDVRVLCEQVAELLLQANADVSACAQDNKANSALHWASTRNACGVARTLLKYGARVDLENKDGKTPLTIETAGAEVLKILKGEDPGVGADPARSAPCVNMPVTNSNPAHAPGQEGGAKSEQDASVASNDEASATSASAGQPVAANGGSSADTGSALAQQSSTGGKLGSGGKGLASVPGSCDPGANDDDEEEDDDESDSDDDDADQAPDSLAAAPGAEAEAGQAAAAAPEAADDDDSSDSDDDEDD